MADKRKAGTGKAKRTVTRGRRTAAGTAGRIAVRRDTAPYRSAAMEEHKTQVREQIEAALAEARRMREDIEQRIDERLKEEDAGSVDQILTQLTATARLRALHPPSVNAGKGGQSKRSRSSK
jgi:ribosomal protein L7/L12